MSEEDDFDDWETRDTVVEKLSADLTMIVSHHGGDYVTFHDYSCSKPGFLEGVLGIKREDLPISRVFIDPPRPGKWKFVGKLNEDVIYEAWTNKVTGEVDEAESGWGSSVGLDGTWDYLGDP